MTPQHSAPERQPVPVEVPVTAAGKAPAAPTTALEIHIDVVTPLWLSIEPEGSEIRLLHSEPSAGTSPLNPRMHGVLTT